MPSSTGTAGGFVGECRGHPAPALLWMIFWATGDEAIRSGACLRAAAAPAPIASAIRPLTARSTACCCIARQAGVERYGNRGGTQRRTLHRLPLHPEPGPHRVPRRDRQRTAARPADLPAGPLGEDRSRPVRARVAGIRKRGVAISRGELDEHILGVAAPIRDSSGKVCAAISVAALAAGLPARDCPKWRVRSGTRWRPSPENLNFSATDARPDKQESHRGAHTGPQRPERPGTGPPAEAPGGLSRNSTRLLHRQPGPLDSQADPARNFRILKIAIDFLKTVTMLKSTSDPVKGDGQS